MKPVMQTKFGKPDGNCMAACFASLTELPIETFEYEVNPSCWLVQLDILLRPLGYTYVEFEATQSFGWCGECYMIGCGKSPRGLSHAVIIRHKVGRKGFHRYEWVHDPHPDGGWVEQTSIGLLLPTWNVRKPIKPKLCLLKNRPCGHYWEDKREKACGCSFGDHCGIDEATGGK